MLVNAGMKHRLPTCQLHHSPSYLTALVTVAGDETGRFTTDYYIVLHVHYIPTFTNTLTYDEENASHGQYAPHHVGHCIGRKGGHHPLQMRTKRMDTLKVDRIPPVLMMSNVQVISAPVIKPVHTSLHNNA